MGIHVRQVAENTLKYYWYPGDKADWKRAAVAAVAGGVAAGLVMFLASSALWAVSAGTSVTAVLAGFGFGRGQVRALEDLAEPGATRGAAVRHAARALWRGAVQGTFVAGAAVLIANLRATGLLADWLLPIAPGLTWAFSYQVGMIYQRRVQQSGTTARHTSQSGGSAGSVRYT